jgi:hypothetical protein
MSNFPDVGRLSTWRIEEWLIQAQLIETISLSLVDNKNGKCCGLNHKAKLNHFHRVMGLPITCSGMVVI